ncbi:hypothetical protein GUITHDRAFT_103909 [Guillardia theta CCMP2712]|uniref:Uncharacterized protein n=1 Tax=Guillardia theta (strain CCMP2712) TaxID=905079 RepID=L1JNQ8_GUITC|nr:hypothetical protein GUITHDRAFT_103909 [Guillardia theta CCMP2712]EKX50097.1 hypothetical protein GUITHDRAFT_103909 [Guillardia theta CCMP2712]|eukprot:XP_005837077.1 hypothetical protein GUITHDRAFT_103909 [Guillardia theta CCMP2712]
MPKDVWPSDAGALSITVIDLNAMLSLRRKLLADDGGKALPYLNRNFELAVWKLNTSTFTWERKPYPAGMNRDTAVKTSEGVVLGSTTSFSTYAVRVTPAGFAPAPATAPASSRVATNTSATEISVENVMTTPAGVSAPSPVAVTSKEFSCSSNAYCVGGIAGGGGAVCALMCIALVYRRRKRQLPVEGSKGGRDFDANKDEMDTGIQELRNKIDADDGEDILLSLQELELEQDQKKEKLAKTAIERDLLEEIRNPFFYSLYVNMDQQILEEESNMTSGQAKIDSIIQEAHNKVGKGSKVTFHFQNQTTEPFQLSADKLQNGLRNSGICAENQKELKKYIIGYDAPSMKDFVDKKLAKTGVQSKEVLVLKEEIAEMQDAKQKRDTESAVALILERKKIRLEEQEKRMQEQANQDRLLQELANSEKSLEKSARTSRNFFSFAKRSRSPSNRSPAATKETETQEISPAEVAKYESENETSLELPRHPRHDELANRLAELERLKQQLLEAGFDVTNVDAWIRKLHDLLLSGREISEGELEDLKAVPMNSKWFDGELGLWRELYHAGRLQPIQIQALEDIEFCWNEEVAQSAISRAAGTVYRKIEISDTLSAVADLGFPSGVRDHDPRVPFWNTLISAVSAVIPPSSVEGDLGFVENRDQKFLLANDEAGSDEGEASYQNAFIHT